MAIVLKPSVVVSQISVKQLCCGDLFTLVLLSTGDLLSWGWNGANASLGKGGVGESVFSGNNTISCGAVMFSLSET